VGTKALYNSGNTKILRTMNNKAANECAPTCCDEASLDISFSGITDCWDRELSCESFNGNNYECALLATGEVACTYEYTSDIGGCYRSIFIRWYFGGENAGKIEGYASISDDEHAGDCFEFEVSDIVYGCSDFPVNNIPNSKNCDDINYYEGDGGTCDIDLI